MKHGVDQIDFSVLSILAFAELACVSIITEV